MDRMCIEFSSPLWLCGIGHQGQSPPSPDWHHRPQPEIVRSLGEHYIAAGQRAPKNKTESLNSQLFWIVLGHPGAIATIATKIYQEAAI